MKKVFVSGCFDMLHSGHIAFLTEAAKYGKLFVGLGADQTVFELKGRYPVNNQNERKYMLEALKCVEACIINKGSGIIDFSETIEVVKPDIFVVNEDGNTPDKETFINKKGIQYIVLNRIPHADLPVRSTTALRSTSNIPYRIDIAGGWLDQPFISSICPGPVVTISIEPTIEFNERSGMASSTRLKAIELWNSDLPLGNPEKLAKILFTFENPPGTKVYSGSQDALGIVLPGLNRLQYDGNYWPSSISSVNNEDILEKIENHIYLVNLGPRCMSYDVLEETKINEQSVKELAYASENCWKAVINKDLKNFGLYLKKSFEAQIKIFPKMFNNHIKKIIDRYKNSAYGWKLSGAGGGGYLILVSKSDIPHAIRIKIRRKDI
ncbi:MAG: adenylyltransferase/cytidyltransferase family protein [Calditrichaceae bacterium]|nr:adenylyltransferase/cytidyltransferase family protein [Calditrichaceae bacterium]MBN2708257.1 adenylyltransferase/cytidyltransferase family protein [Calditrichaceae bacterium]RQV92278.1 MAG: cytidyltransferase [Calditrichota bacterium]